MDWYSRSGIFSRAKCVFLWKANVTLPVTNYDLLVFFSNEMSEYKIPSAKIFAIKLVKK